MLQQPSIVSPVVGSSQPGMNPSGTLSPLVMDDPSLSASLPWPPEPLEASDEDSLLGPTAASSAAAAAANSHALAAAAAMAAGSMANSLGSQSPKTKPQSLSAPIIVGKDGKPYIPDNQERRSNALAAMKLICNSFGVRIESMRHEPDEALDVYATIIIGKDINTFSEVFAYISSVN